MHADEVIILVGGLGTRLRAVVADVPKPLAQVAGRPFLAWVLDHLASQRIRRCILATGYLSDKVEHAIGATWAGMQVTYSVEEFPLGTGGAVAQAVNLLQGDSVHVLNGDTFLRYSLAALESITRTKQAELGLALASVNDVSRYGAVTVADGQVQRFQEKGGTGAGFVNAGSYYLTREALAALPRHGSFSLETEVLLPAVAKSTVAALTSTAEFIDIGVPSDYERAQFIFGEAHGNI